MNESLIIFCPIYRHFDSCGEIIRSLLIAVDRDMPTFLTPQHSKVKNATTGATEVCYTFSIIDTESEKKLSFMVEEASDISVESLDRVILENKEWWNQWLTEFLTASAKYFSKAYTVQQIQKITKHTLEGTLPTLFPASVLFVPETIQIRGGIFWVNWSYVATPARIDIPDLDVQEESLPVLADHGLEEAHLDDILSADATEELEIESPAKFYDKQKAKEARLKAKIALYKAQHQIAKYYEKYGTEISDSDSDSESDEEYEEEEVQL
jgi:hypothetical protein